MKPGIRNQIIGMMRFSYPSEGGFLKGGQGDDPAFEARLYAPDRMERRFRMFEKLALPSLLAQTDDDFRMVFLIGRSLPDLWRDRLTDLIAPLRGARVVALPSMPHYKAIRRAFAMALSDTATHVTGFRLDDDDALDRDHIARMRQVVGALLPISGLDLPLVTGCNRGFFLELRADGNRLLAANEKNPGAQGLAMTTPAQVSENIFRRNHRFASQFYNTFTDANQIGFIRTVHMYNDSDPHATGSIEPMEWDAAAPLIAQHFPFTAEMLQTL